MKILIVYDSLYGNTGKIAQAVAEGIGPEVRLGKAQDADVLEFSTLDLLVIGTPTHGGMGSKPIQDLLKRMPKEAVKGIRAAVFDTRFFAEEQGWFVKKIVNFFKHAAPRITTSLKEKGALIIADGEGFFVKGKEGPLKENELERAKAWGKKLRSVL